MTTKKTAKKATQKASPKNASSEKTSPGNASPAVEKVNMNDWLAKIKDSHETALADLTSVSGCCQVTNPQTGGIFEIPTDSTTCTAIGGQFSPGPC